MAVPEAASAPTRADRGPKHTDSVSAIPRLKIGGDDLLGVEAGPDLQLDLAVLGEASAAARTSRPGGETDGKLIATLRSADAAYRGEFLEGFRLEDAPEFEFWVESQRGLWRRRIGEVLSRLAELEAETGELAAAVTDRREVGGAGFDGRGGPRGRCAVYG